MSVFLTQQNLEEIDFMRKDQAVNVMHIVHRFYTILPLIQAKYQFCRHVFETTVAKL